MRPEAAVSPIQDRILISLPDLKLVLQGLLYYF